ncbi:MAG: U-box domain-containing protein [Candidatus Aenigmarchaeota archaeon]|nr:U-box domain-containing protein [Candidatus Aenigmarchaeota archaeon]
MEPLESFNCPITLEIMTDPVMDNENRSYERAAIVKWLENHDTAPLSRSPLRVEDLRDNRDLKNVIEEFIKKNNKCRIQDTKSDKHEKIDTVSNDENHDMATDDQIDQHEVNLIMDKMGNRRGMINTFRKEVGLYFNVKTNVKYVRENLCLVSRHRVCAKKNDILVIARAIRFPKKVGLSLRKVKWSLNKVRSFFPEYASVAEEYREFKKGKFAELPTYVVVLKKEEFLSFLLKQDV